jgi:signal transduction histidine kinase
VGEDKIRNDYVSRSRALEELRSNTYVSGTRIREYLLDPDDRFAGSRRAEFLETQRLIESEIAAYRNRVTPEGADLLQQLSQQMSAYFGALAPPLKWNAAERRDNTYSFMQSEVLPRRTEILTLIDRVQRSADRDLEASSEAVGQTVATFRVRLVALLLLTLAIGLAVASLSLWRLLRLEREAQLRFQEVLSTREELQRLSAELLSAQETERRRISRELHDEVGQVLSAISLSLSAVRSAFLAGNSQEGFEQLERVQSMAEKNLGVVRNIALLLRPTMLDDLGLLPALRWLAREVTRDTGVDTDVLAESFPDDLPEEHRTCIFRIAQEAVRNAARHSGARHVHIYLKQEADAIHTSIQDDGKGFDPRQDKGLGILGMEERALHLGGVLRVKSERGRGTLVELELPLSGGSRDPRAGRETGYHVQISPLRTA